MRWLGLDIGGANLKAADRHGWVRSMPFPLWRDPHGLADALASLIQAAPPSAGLAITMTGELCDCFRSKAEGVRHILSAVDDVAAGRDVLVYLLDGRFVPLDEAQSVPHLAAASNWHALAWFVCRFVQGRTGVLIDIGSTTTDIVPLKDGRPFPAAFTDTERLFAGELVYTGVGRTPVCAVVDALPWRGRKCPVAAELFASSADAYVLLGDIPAEPEATWTADGRPLTAEFARERLARMICADAHELSAEDALSAAVCVRDAQLAQLRAAIRRVLTARRLATHCIILSGSGEFLARRLIEDGAVAMTVVSLAARLGETASRCAAAHALAVLAERHE